jgi:hypothetical protein
MSEKERQKKDGRDKNKENQAMRENNEHSSSQSSAKTEKDKPAGFREGLPRNDQSESKQ